MYHSLRKVARSSNIEGIGGALIPICSHLGKFTYMFYADITTDILDLSNNGQDSKIIEFGSAEGGGYTVEFVNNTPNHGNGKEIGFYFLQGGFGIYYKDNQYGLKVPEIVSAKTPAEWIYYTSKKLVFGLTSQYVTIDHWGMLGEKLLNENNCIDAIYCYEKNFKEEDLFKNRQDIADRYISGYAVALFNSKRTEEAIQLLNRSIAQIEKPHLSLQFLGEMLTKRNQ